MVKRKIKLLIILLFFTLGLLAGHNEEKLDYTDTLHKEFFFEAKTDTMHFQLKLIQTQFIEADPIRKSKYPYPLGGSDIWKAKFEFVETNKRTNISFTIKDEMSCHRIANHLEINPEGHEYSPKVCFKGFENYTYFIEFFDNEIDYDSCSFIFIRERPNLEEKIITLKRINKNNLLRKFYL